MCAAGAKVVFPIVDFCGERMARLRDPYGHVWLLIQQTEELSPDEIQRRRDAWMPPGDHPKA
jgi:PhnB protein